MGGVKELPVFVWLVLQLVMLPSSLLALPFLTVLTACQASIAHPTFAAGSGRRALHALLAPLRLGAVLLAIATVGAVPGAGVWFAKSMLGGSVVWSAIFAAAAVAVSAVGAAWILSAHGIWGYLPPWPPLRIRDVVGGVADSVLDVLAAVCAVFVVCTMIRLPWLLTAVFGDAPDAPDASSARQVLFSQAAFAVVDILLAPLMLALVCTCLRLPRLQQQIRKRVAIRPPLDSGQQHSHPRCVAIMNSWTARVIVVEQMLMLLFVDLVLLPLVAAVACSLYRMPALVIDCECPYLKRWRALHICADVAVAVAVAVAAAVAVALHQCTKRLKVRVGEKKALVSGSFWGRI
eukprot:SAG31_NODE_1098_length_9919_cov_2.877495_1_plen_348_part_00